jgi:hypothetical protein
VQRRHEQEVVQKKRRYRGEDRGERAGEHANGEYGKQVDRGRVRHAEDVVQHGDRSCRKRQRN